MERTLISAFAVNGLLLRGINRKFTPESKRQKNIEISSDAYSYARGF